MNLYEFEGKQLLKKYKIPVPAGHVLKRGEEKGMASLLQESHPGEKKKPLTFPLVVKAQVQSGKRGKGGGVLFAEDEEELARHAHDLFGKKICNDEVLYILVEDKKPIVKEFYLAVTYHTQKKSPVVLFSVGGGMEVEAGEQTVQEYFTDPLKGFEEFRMRNLLVK